MSEEQNKHNGMINFNELYEIYSYKDAKELKKREEEVNFEAPTNIQFTSGTTGYPKGATLTHHNILNNALMHGNVAEYNSDTRLCISVPLYHCMGMVMGSLAILNHGGAAIYPCEGFKASLSLEAITKHRCDTVIAVPSMFIQMIKEYKDNKSKYSLDFLRKGVIAGSICPEELLRKCNEVLGIEYMSTSYGMTETSPITFQLRRNSPYEKTITTVGQVSPHTEAKIVDKNGKAIPVGK